MGGTASRPRIKSTLQISKERYSHFGWTKKRGADQLAFHEQVRNGKAHAWASTPEKHRRKYFDLIKHWLECMLAAYPETDPPVTEASLRMMLEPLPDLEW